MNINNAFPSKWLKSGDLPEPGEPDMIVVMRSVVIEGIGQGEGDEQDRKPVLYFHDSDKGLVLNKTNADTIAKLYGPETDGWVGKPIALFATEVDFAGKQTLAIRVRMRAPKSPYPKASMPRGGQKAGWGPGPLDDDVPTFDEPPAPTSVDTIKAAVAPNRAAMDLIRQLVDLGVYDRRVLEDDLEGYECRLGIRRELTGNDTTPMTPQLWDAFIAALQKVVDANRPPQ